MSGKKRKLRCHPAALKLEAVRRVEAGEAVSEVASSYGLRRTQLYAWRDIYRREGGFEGRPRGRRRRGMALAPAGSAAREAELERLVGQQQVELDFLREALRLLGQADRPISGPGAASSSGSSQPRRPGRKAG